jgi:hypothetical protein
VLSLYRSRALRNLTDIIKTYKFDIAVQEVRCKGQNIIQKKRETAKYIIAAMADYIKLA